MLLASLKVLARPHDDNSGFHFFDEEPHQSDLDKRRHPEPLILEAITSPRTIAWNGTPPARAPTVSISDFRDLVARQLADALRLEVIQFTSEGAASRDFRFRDDIRASAGSAPANIAEGFGRFRPLEFAQFLGYAKASLEETQDHLIEAKDRRLIDAKLFPRLWNLANRASGSRRT